MDRQVSKKKGLIPKSKVVVPKQRNVADRGYEVFTQEARRSSYPGGSSAKMAASNDEGSG
jgi:hypothetical protein